LFPISPFPEGLAGKTGEAFFISRSRMPSRGILVASLCVVGPRGPKNPSAFRSRCAMGLFGNNVFNTLQDLFVAQLEDIYDAENRLTEALPKMRDAATSPPLKNAFDSHLEETRGHVRRLQQIFTQLGLEPSRETCPAMKGLIKEGQEMIDAKGDPSVRDAALIAAGQRVEHYEMAGYGVLRSLARRMGMGEAVNILQMTLNEEGAADRKLSEIAESSVNDRAAAVVGIV
jgi:ferritin-like metal-binding protein YciE